MNSTSNRYFMYVYINNGGILNVSGDGENATRFMNCVTNYSNGVLRADIGGEYGAVMIGGGGYEMKQVIFDQCATLSGKCGGLYVCVYANECELEVKNSEFRNCSGSGESTGRGGSVFIECEMDEYVYDGRIERLLSKDKWSGTIDSIDYCIAEDYWIVVGYNGSKEGSILKYLFGEEYNESKEGGVGCEEGEGSGTGWGGWSYMSEEESGMSWNGSTLSSEDSDVESLSWSESNEEEYGSSPNTSDVYVASERDGGRDSNVCGWEKKPCATIKQAMANDGNAVNIYLIGGHGNHSGEIGGVVFEGSSKAFRISGCYSERIGGK